MPDEEWLETLRGAVTYWSQNDYQSAWIHVPTSRAGLIEALTRDDDVNGSASSSASATTRPPLQFEVHHVNATEQTIILKKWLRSGEDKVPPYCTHQVGVAGLVLSDRNELLLVKEWRGPPSNRVPSNQWKLPGGLLDAGESLEEGCVREVWEETGIECDAEDTSVLTFWHRHGLTFGKSDLYYVCLLRPQLNHPEIRMDPVEISDVTWMPVKEFLETQDHPLITHIFKEVFLLEKGDDLRLVEDGMERLQPAADIIKGGVQWPNRDPYPTYRGSTNRIPLVKKE